MTARGVTDLDRAFARLADGDRSAFNEVFTVLWPRLLAFCERMLGSSADAEDAAQNALTTLLSQSANYDPDRSALGWALALATWECRTQRRRKTRSRIDDIDVPERVAPGLNPEAESARTELLEAAEFAMAALSESDKQLVKDTLFELAEADGPDSAALRKRRQRAFERLRAAWRRLYGDNHA